MARKLVTTVDGGYIAEFPNTRKWFRRFVGPRTPEMLCLVYSASYDSLCFGRPIVNIGMDADLGQAGKNQGSWAQMAYAFDARAVAKRLTGTVSRYF